MNLQTQCSNKPAESGTTTKKPFRSELNLVLSYPNSNANDESPLMLDSTNAEVTPPLPMPMELISTLSNNNLLLQNLPSPLPSPIPSSPLTPPTNFKTIDTNLFERAPDYSLLKFPPINAPVPIFSSNNSVFCTVSAPSTPASDRKCIDKFCINDDTNSNETQRSVDKKKAKRVSIVNTSKDDADDKASDNQEVNNDIVKDAESKKSDPSGNHHSHIHRNHSHSHLHPKRRMSLDNTIVSFNQL